MPSYSPHVIPPTRTAQRFRGLIERATAPAARQVRWVVLVGGALIFYVERGGRDAAVLHRGSDTACTRSGSALPDQCSRACSES